MMSAACLKSRGNPYTNTFDRAADENLLCTLLMFLSSALCATPNTVANLVFDPSQEVDIIYTYASDIVYIVIHARSHLNILYIVTNGI